MTSIQFLNTKGNTFIKHLEVKLKVCISVSTCFFDLKIDCGVIWKHKIYSCFIWYFVFRHFGTSKAVINLF